MQTNKVHWPSLLILVVLGLSASSTLLVSFGIGVNSLIVLFTKEGDAAGQMISALAFGFEGAVLLLCCWFVFQKTIGWEQSGRMLNFPFESWQFVAVIGLAAMSVGVGAVVVFTDVSWLAWLALPVLTLVVIVPPIWLLFGIGSNGIQLGQRWRIFGIFGLGMTLAPLVMIVLEMILLAGGIIFGSIFIAVQYPDLLKELTNLGMALKREMDGDAALKLVAPYITNPASIVAVIGYIAVAVPLIEELFKPLAVWLFARKLESPAQGFVMGMLSGAAFALVESLNASAGTETWPVIVTVRAGTSMLHITASGLVGWGIVSAFRERRILRLFAAYFSAVLIHGLWNACAVGVGFSLVGEALGKPELLFRLLPAMAGGMFVLAVGMFSILIVANKRIRKSSTLPIEHRDDVSVVVAQVGSPSTTPRTERDEGVQ